LLAFSGLIEDLFNGLAYTRSAPTWAIWIGVLILVGLLKALAEGGFEWITEADRTTDPLGKRVLRLVLGMMFCGRTLDRIHVSPSSVLIAIPRSIWMSLKRRSDSGCAMRDSGCAIRDSGLED